MTTRHTISRADTLYSQRAYYPPANPLPGLPISPTNYVNFGAIAAASANAICTNQASGAGNALNINGALAAAGVATIPTPRNVVAAWTTAAQITVTGTDYYGQPQTEQSGGGVTAFTGKKAFATITAVTFSVAVTAATVGTGVKIGLPYLVGVNGILDALTDSLPDVGYTLVVGDQTSPATSTTGDVRGTIAATTAPNGAHQYAVNLVVYDRTGGVDQKSGAYGVTPA